MHPQLKKANNPALGGMLNNIEPVAIRRKTRLLALVTATLLIGACANKPSIPDAKVESRTVAAEETTIPEETLGDSSTPLNDNRFNIEQAEYYQGVAKQANSGFDSSQQLQHATLSAAEYYIQAGDFNRAEAAIEPLLSAELEGEHRDRYDIVRAYTSYSKQQYRVALNRLEQLRFRHRDSVLSTSAQMADALLLSSFCHQELGEFEPAISALIERESILSGSARAETSRYIWQVVNTLSAEQKQSIIDLSTNAAVRNRVEQSSFGQVGSQITEPKRFDQWRDSQKKITQQSLTSIWNNDSARNIAVLLPLSSRFNKAAQAVRDGIEYQHSLNESLFRPNVQFYDVGSNPYQITQYYSAAIANGADFVIGPLGRDYANQMTSFARQSEQTPTILLGGDSGVGRHLSRLTMSPEWEGELVARHALAEGHVTAALLAPNTAAGQRTADAFRGYWLEHGGRISNVINYSNQQFDHSTELKQLFSIGESEFRYTKLSNTLGLKPKFSAYRRADIDFIFMISDTKSGRLLRPQINFFSASKIPVYANGSIFNGIQDRTNNVDLDQTGFPVMPWMLRSADVAPYAGQLNMLFATGADAYQVAGAFKRMRSSQNTTVDGNMGTLSLDAYGEIRYQPLWATFNNGTAEAGTELQTIERSPNSLNRFGPEQKGENSYDESNWDARQSRRKEGP